MSFSRSSWDRAYPQATMKPSERTKCMLLDLDIRIDAEGTYFVVKSDPSDTRGWKILTDKGKRPIPPPDGDGDEDVAIFTTVEKAILAGADPQAYNCEWE